MFMLSYPVEFMILFVIFDGSVRFGYWMKLVSKQIVIYFRAYWDFETHCAVYYL